MARGNVDDQHKLMVSQVVEQLERTKELTQLSNEARELADALGVELNQDQDIYQLRVALDVEVKNVLQKEDVTVEELLDQLEGENKQHHKEEEELGSKSLNKADLERLLKDLDEHEAKKNISQEAERLAKEVKKPEIRSQIQEAIERKLTIASELENKLKAEGINPEVARQTSDQLSDRQVVLENQLKEAKLSENEAETVATKVVEKSRGSTKVDENEIVKAVSELKFENPKNKAEAVALVREVGRDFVAEERVIIRKEEIIAQTTDKVIEAVSDVVVTTEQQEHIREIIRERVDTAVKESGRVVNEIREIPRNNGQNITVSLSQEIGMAVGRQLPETTVLGAIQEAEKEVAAMAQQEPVLVELYRGSILEQEAIATLAQDNQKSKDIEEFARVVRGMRYAPERIPMAQAENAAIERATTYTDEGGRHFSPGQIQVAVQRAEVATNILNSKEPANQQIDHFLQLARRLNTNKLHEKSEAFRAVEGTVKVFAGDTKLMGALERVQSFVNFKQKFVSKISGELLAKAGFTSQSTEIFLANSASQIASFGLKEGIKNILGGLLGKGAVEAAVVGAAGTGMATTAGTGALAATGLVTGPIGWIATGVVLLGNIGIGILKRGWENLKRIFGSDAGKQAAGAVKDLNAGSSLGRWLRETVPAAMTAIGGGLMALGAGFLQLFSGLSAISIGPLIGTIVIGVFVGLFILQTIQSMQMSALVPPPLEQTNCKKLEPTGSPSVGDGNINCSQDVPEMNVPGVNKDNFFRMADQWRGGTNHARECFNDVVCRARSAGVDETFALWVWLHESGASNYSIKDVKDFGIVGQATAPPKDFNAQLSYFLNLGLGNPCPGLDFWLGWSTNFLTGGCDTNKKVDGGGGVMVNGKEYLSAFKGQWAWLSSGAMPAQIRKTGTGESCGGGASYSADNSTYTYVDENGDTWLCQNTPGVGVPGSSIETNFPAWDPSTPVPEGCPDREPVNGGRYTEGPFAPGCSHQSMVSAAVDYGIGAGSPIYATHPGVVSYGSDNVYGYFIDLHGSCEGKAFVTRYAHMPAGGYRVGNGATVKAGDLIGIVDTTGSSTGNHLHYHISQLDKNKFGQYLGITYEKTKALWGCCGRPGDDGYNGITCPSH